MAEMTATGGSGRNYRLEGLTPATEVTKRFELTARTLRFYEQVGLLKPIKTERMRWYSEEDLRALRMVRVLQRLGYKIKDIEKILPESLKTGRPAISKKDALRAILLLKNQKAEIDDLIALLSEVIASRPVAAAAE